MIMMMIDLDYSFAVDGDLTCTKMLGLSHVSTHICGQALFLFSYLTLVISHKSYKD